MLERAAVLSAVAPAVVHGFTDRRDGHSQGRFATLNLGERWGDDPEAVRRNLAAVADAGGFDPAWLVRADDVLHRGGGRRGEAEWPPGRASFAG